MIVIPEHLVEKLFTAEAAFEAVEAVFAAMSRREAVNFPVVRDMIGHADAVYGIKSGFDRAGLALGLKAGGYWPNNGEKGLTNHQSAVLLFDADTGRPAAIVSGNHLTAMRTAAASAISIRHLARPDARVLGMVGAGHQAGFQLRAALAQRAFDRVVAWNLHPDMLDRLGGVAAEEGVPFEAVELDRLGAEADVIVTITSSFAPILKRCHVRPGTHIAAMGTDTKGKQELDPALVAAARVFTDEVAQSASIGECQHAVAAGLISREDIGEIGAVITGTLAGRRSADDITLFDGTGVALQDLAGAARVVELARDTGPLATVDL
ncbi:iminosuccinate reductase BhcD [Nitratireductor alexandrii]|uniref:iminosuccinate reductase BhcD n=1 Tax=Nitratireductor alexandrii TaxID=2448161 RepID=UPI000FDC982B|nr:iminosuccinate reductase BhcD [Nitratireductor alexandrii]